MERRQFQERCRKIAKEIIQEGFPELKGERILIYVPWVFRKAYSGLAFNLPPFQKIILINKQRSNKSDIYLKGLLAHEFGHHVLYKKRNFWENVRIAFFYWLDSKIRRKEEDDVNKLIIQRGYARDIYETTKRGEKRKDSAGIQKYYMSSEEIKSYAKRMGKW
jgi:hypothetical protein